MDRYTHRILPMGEQTAAAIERVLGLYKLLSKPDHVR
jgi:hypothetical protein